MYDVAAEHPNGHPEGLTRIESYARRSVQWPALSHTPLDTKDAKCHPRTLIETESQNQMNQEDLQWPIDDADSA